MSHLQANNKITTKLAERSHENIERVIDLLRRAQNLEQQYTDWMASLPPSWITETTNWSGLEPSNLASALVYPGKVYSFGDLWMANKFSVVRSCRILLWSTILRCVAWLNGPLEYMVTPEYAEASRTCRVLIQDITSSVPYVSISLCLIRSLAIHPFHENSHQFQLHYFSQCSLPDSNMPCSISDGHPEQAQQ